MANSYLLNVLRKLKFGGGSVMVWGMISSNGSWTNCSFSWSIKKFFASMLFHIYTKRQLKLQYLCKTMCLATKIKLKFSWRERNSCYEVATTKPKYESYRKRTENHRREGSEQKSSKWYLIPPCLTLSNICKVGIKGKEEQSRERSSALLYTSV